MTRKTKRLYLIRASKFFNGKKYNSKDITKWVNNEYNVNYSEHQVSLKMSYMTDYFEKVEQIDDRWIYQTKQRLNWSCY